MNADQTTNIIQIAKTLLRRIADPSLTEHNVTYMTRLLSLLQEAVACNRLAILCIVSSYWELENSFDETLRRFMHFIDDDALLSSDWKSKKE